jgi:membrane protease YdiL (CAAX protease family)
MTQNIRPLATAVSPFRFFALTFFLSWLIWIPLALSHFGLAFQIPESASAVVRLLGVLMPAVSALLLVSASGEKDATQRLWGRLFVWRVGWKWWIAAAFVYPIILVASALTYNWFGPSSISFIPQDIAALIMNIIFLLIAVLGEEIGWHGVALPALQQKYSALKSSIILGICWGIWHLPFWLLLDTFDQFGIPYLVVNFVFVFPMVFYMTWFFNHSQYSLLLPIVFHLTFNIVNTALLPVTLDLGSFAILGALSWIIAFLILPRIEAGHSSS